MTTQDILSQRLNNQQLAHPMFETPQQIVSWFGAVQSQDYASAKWALAQRLIQGTEELIEKAFTDGQILRTHVMRPTWHFVTPNDIRWMLKLTSPRVKMLLAHYDRTLGLTQDTVRMSQTIFQETLTGGKMLTREELGLVLQKYKLPATGQALAHCVMHAELDGILCSGPRKGKHFTYMLLDERVPKFQNLTNEEALAELTKRYFTSHGPATIKDFVWWSGVTTVDAKHGLAMNKSWLINESVDGEEYWFHELIKEKKTMQTMYLLPNYDEYTIAYKDRNLFYNSANNLHLDMRGNMIFQHMIMYQGELIGVWRRTEKRNTVGIESRLFKTLSAEEMKLVTNTFELYGTYLHKTIELL